MALGLVFGLVAAFQNICGARGARERRFVLLNCVAKWVVTILIFVGRLYLHAPWRYIVLALYFVIVPPATYFSCLRRHWIRWVEEKALGCPKQENVPRL